MSGVPHEQYILRECSLPSNFCYAVPRNYYYYILFLRHQSLLYCKEVSCFFLSRCLIA